MKKLNIKNILAFTATCIINGLIAQTSGPLQSEYGSFEPAGSQNMVNRYTGDFVYNIPLLSVPDPSGEYSVNE